ncbi:hypothetical protein DL769_010132 [Monosporascus sp. CRB-8-3]|nr:hypothetical protein DL769_010132 [Monosporascus sp. CRB-8-3]
MSGHELYVDDQNQIVATGPYLPCDFVRWSQCIVTFDVDDFYGWVEHVEQYHLGDNFPRKVMCWFCSETFKVGKNASKEERRTNFWNHLFAYWTAVPRPPPSPGDGNFPIIPRSEITPNTDNTAPVMIGPGNEASRGPIFEDLLYDSSGSGLRTKLQTPSSSTNGTISAIESINQGERSPLEIEALGNTFKTCTLADQSASPDANSSPTESEPTESASSSGSDSNTEDLTKLPLEHMDSLSLVTMILGHKGQRLERDILCFFERLVDKQLGIVQHNGGQQSRQSPRDIDSTREESSSNSTFSSSGSSKKRSISNDKDDEDATGGDGRGNTGRNRKAPRLGEPAQQKIACPFMKRHPVEFSTWHIELQQHMRTRESCPLREIETAMGFITQLQWNEISVKKRGAIPDRWKEIYTILFPDVEESQIPGPYGSANGRNYLVVHDVSETAEQLGRMINCDEFEAHMRADLPRRVLAQLNREFHIMAEHARQRVAEIAQEQSVATLAAFLQERGSNAAGGPGVHPGILDDSFPFDFGLLNQRDIFTGNVDAPWLEVPNEREGQEQEDSMT